MEGNRSTGVEYWTGLLEWAGPRDSERSEVGPFERMWLR